MVAITTATRRAGVVLMVSGALLLLGSTIAGATPGEHGLGKAVGNPHVQHDASSGTDAGAGSSVSSNDSTSANDPGPYNGDPNGSPSLNGNGGGGANGEPCAGCVGNADDKNPPGQLPGPQDHNNGYECDGNSGIARTNPAHTGCTTTTTVAPTTTTVSPTTTTTASTTTTAAPTTTTAAPTTTVTVLGATVTNTVAPTKVLGATLARTGSNVRQLLQLAALALLLGGLCLVTGRRSGRPVSPVHRS